VNDDSGARLQHLLDRLKAGDDEARREIVGHTYDRLRLIASRMFRKRFPRLARFHESGSVVHEAVLQIQKALAQIHPPTGPDYYRWAGHQIRWTLLRMCKRLDHRLRTVPLGGPSAADESDVLPSLYDETLADTRDDPADLARWTEFHLRMAGLPDEQRFLVDCLWYNGLSQTETAGLLGVPPWQVHRRWTDLRLELSTFLPWGEGPPDSPGEPG
jgi:RNA polymerase sigma factor (sigma-70 family)